MQVLFVWDANGADDVETARKVAEGGSPDDDVRRAALELASAAWRQRETIDQWVERIAPQWPPRRQPGVDRALLRIAVWEMTSGGTPPKVAIDEAIELAKQFSTEQSPSFVNGVLDAILREQRTLTQGGKEGSGFGVQGSKEDSGFGVQGSGEESEIQADGEVQADTEPSPTDLPNPTQPIDAAEQHHHDASAPLAVNDNQKTDLVSEP